MGGGAMTVRFARPVPTNAILKERITLERGHEGNPQIPSQGGGRGAGGGREWEEAYKKQNV